MKTDIKLPPKAQTLFKRFLQAPKMWKNEVSSLHPLDRKKFYSFVLHCTQYNGSLTKFELEKLLNYHRFSKELINELCSIYHHGREILKFKNNRI